MPPPDANLDRFSARASDGVAGCSKGCVTLCDECADLELTEAWDAVTIEAMTIAAEPALPSGASVELHEPLPFAPVQQPASDRAWLDARLADIAEKLQGTLHGFDPAPALGAFSERLDNFEARLEAAVVRADAREDRDSLRFIEAHIREIDDQFDKMRGQIARLDHIDGRLSEIWQNVQQVLPVHAGGLDGLVEGAVSRALAAASVLRAQGGDASDEAATRAVLQRMEEALGRLIERVEVMEHAAHRAADLDDPSKDEARIGAAYAEGVRALGRTLPSMASLRGARDLHADDYASPRTDAAAERGPGRLPGDALEREGAKSPTAPSNGLAQRERSADEQMSDLRASAQRAKRRAQAAAENAAVMETKDVPALTARPSLRETAEEGFTLPKALVAAAARAQEKLASHARFPQRSLAKGRWNRGFFLALAMLGLGSASYLTVASIMGPNAEPPVRALQSGTPPSNEGVTRVAQSLTGTDTGVEPSTPAALPPPQEPDMPGAEARAATLPATIASASLRHAAANGDPAAEFEIAARYAEGRGVTADQAQAFAWYHRAAMHAHVPAQFRLGSHYEQGVGVAKDVERAKVWYRRAAEKGHAKAMHNLAVLLASGGDKDLPQAARWFREAAERNLADSQYNLAVMSESGQGMQVNLAEAYKWYALAARSGDLEAGRRLQQVKARLSKGEIAAVEKAVASWLPQPAATMPGEPDKADRAAP